MKKGSSAARGFLYSSCLALLVLLVSALHAAISEKPSAGIISDPSRLWSPGKLAMDNELNLYVVDGYTNSVWKYDRSGKALDRIEIRGASAVAAGPDGTLYIGSHWDYSVAIYSGGGVTGLLGEGRNEFSSILDIAADNGTGDIYVVDGTANSVRVYYPSGILKAIFSGFNSPAAVAVSDDDVYVIDAPAVDAQSTAPRISLFTKSGRLVRSFDERSAKKKYLSRPVDVVVDQRGNIFLADASRRAVVVYGSGGNVIGEITASGNMLNTAVGLALSRDRRLYAASSETHSVLEIGLGGTVYAKAGALLDFQSKKGDRLTFAVLGY